ncbi:MAG TPA: heavy metal-binding domain-containing protein [Candidatus Dormibacteraeota bacterium]|jgi:uncharacterized protein YbjQ (UPF0145 family)|nr:heavy metal-binding domain-containing protein [Candidatus Dormibacteraeota bacterium]
MTTMPPPPPVSLPEAAQRRLDDLRRRASAGRALATTDLSVDELMLVHEAGFDPVGMVMGSSVYHLGFQWSSISQSQEMQVLTAAMYNARELAMSRMEAEAAALEADGVVGVNLDIRFMNWGDAVGEFTAVGTAVRSRNGGTWRQPNGLPFTSDLSGQAFWKLVRTGYRPLGLVLGNCVYHVGRQKMGMFGGWKNKEMDVYTQCLYEARELAMSRMQAEAEQLGAQVVVESRITHHQHIWESHVMEFFAIGTAATSLSDTHEYPQPQVVVSVDNRM